MQRRLLCPFGLLLAALALHRGPVAGQAPLRHQWKPTFSGAPLDRSVDPTLVVVGSALIPGTGQFLLGAERWVPYAALEAWAWLSFLDRHHAARRFQDDYRDLAWATARRVSVGERRDSIFEYYEAMSHYELSGAFDADPAQDGLQPELDNNTFNGTIWVLARSIYIPGGGNYPPDSPQYQQALDYYRQHAIPDTYAWAWGASDLERQTFSTLIRNSDAAFRTATRLLGVIVANHVVSAVDALVSSRFQRRGTGAGVQVHLDSRLRGAGADTRFETALHLSW